MRTYVSAIRMKWGEIPVKGRRGREFFFQAEGGGPGGMKAEYQKLIKRKKSSKACNGALLLGKKIRP